MNGEFPSYEDLESEDYELSDRERKMLSVLEQIPIRSLFFDDTTCYEANWLINREDYEYIVNKPYYYVGNLPSTPKVANQSIALFLSRSIKEVIGIFEDWEAYLPDLLSKQENFSRLFWEGDAVGYSSFEDKLANILYPFPGTDENVCKAVHKMINQIYVPDIWLFHTADAEYIRRGTLSGLFRKCIEVIEEWPEKFVSYPDLVTATPKIRSASITFEEIFKSSRAYSQCVESLEHEFFKEEGKIWDYKKSPKTAFIALRDVLFAKGYLVKRISDDDLIGIAKNTFGLEISNRTFKEYESIRKAYSLFKLLPLYKN